MEGGTPGYNIKNLGRVQFKIHLLQISSNRFEEQSPKSSGGESTTIKNPILKRKRMEGACCHQQAFTYTGMVRKKKRQEEKKAKSRRKGANFACRGEGHQRESETHGKNRSQASFSSSQQEGRHPRREEHLSAKMPPSRKGGIEKKEKSTNTKR